MSCNISGRKPCLMKQALFFMVWWQIFFSFLFTLLCTGCPSWLTPKILWSHDNEYVFSLNAATKFWKQSYDLKEIKNFNICFNIINSSVLEVTDISDKPSSAALMRFCVWHPQNACHRYLMTCSFFFSGSVWSCFRMQLCLVDPVLSVGAVSPPQVFMLFCNHL